MKNEKILVLFESMEALIEEQKKATNRLNKAIAKAENIEGYYKNNEDIIAKINTNFRKIESESAKAIKRVEKKANAWNNFSFFTSLLLVIALVGSATFYYSKTYFDEKIVNEKAKELATKYIKNVESNLNVKFTNEAVIINADSKVKSNIN